MFKKIVALIVLISIFMISTDSPSDAFFFKRKKEAIKESVEKAHKKEEKKILLVQIYASWCPGCKNIEPTLDQLIKEVADINFIKLDVSTSSKAQEASKIAKELKISDFYTSHKSKTATVAIITPTTGEVVTVLENDNDIESYKQAIEKAKTQEKSLENPP